jgi:hypothetical protein
MTCGPMAVHIKLFDRIGLIMLTTKARWIARVLRAEQACSSMHAISVRIQVQCYEANVLGRRWKAGALVPACFSF